MPAEESDTKAFVVVYADLVFAENPQKAFDNMSEGGTIVSAPISEAIELGDIKDYPMPPVNVKIDGAVREKVNAFVQEYSRWIQGQIKEKKESETKTDALNALKIDMVSVEKRLEQLGASKILQAIADIVSGAIEDLQVKAERDEEMQERFRVVEKIVEPVDNSKEGEALSPSPETKTYRLHAIDKVLDLIMDEKEKNEKEIRLESISELINQLESENNALEWIAEKMDAVKEKEEAQASSPSLDKESTRREAVTSVRNFISDEQEEIEALLDDEHNNLTISELTAKNDALEWIDKQLEGLERSGDGDIPSSQSSAEAIEVEGLDKKFRVWVELISDKSIKAEAIAEFDELERHGDLEIHAEVVDEAKDSGDLKKKAYLALNLAREAMENLEGTATTREQAERETETKEAITSFFEEYRESKELWNI